MSKDKCLCLIAWIFLRNRTGAFQEPTLSSEEERPRESQRVRRERREGHHSRRVRQNGGARAHQREQCNSQQDEHPVAAIVHKHRQQSSLLVHIDIVVSAVGVPGRSGPRPPPPAAAAAAPAATPAAISLPVPVVAGSHIRIRARPARISATSPHSEPAIALRVVPIPPAEELKADERHHGDPQQG